LVLASKGKILFQQLTANHRIMNFYSIIMKIKQLKNNIMKNRFFRFLIGLFVFGLLIAIIQNQIFAEPVPDDFDDIKKLAEKGDIDAQFDLGWMYLNGIGVPQDYKQAVYWFTKAAEKGHAGAQDNLGASYYNGKGVPQDYKQAAYWLTKAAEQGIAYSQNILGILYLYGKGVPQDYKQAAYWFTKAAEQGETYSQNNLGVSYLTGEGVPQDYKQAVYWFTKAAEKGHAKAQTNLGMMYGEGQGVPQNNKLAYVWSSLAASGGNEIARNNRDIFARKLTPQLLTEAQELAAKLQYKIAHQEKSSKFEPATPKTATLYEPEVKGFGSGFIISKDGYILTCFHIIQGSGTVKVKIDDTLHSAKVIRKDSINDLALLKISGSFPALAFSSKRSGRMGQEVFTIGYPNPILQGVNAKLTKGSINSLTGIQDDLRLYQISIPVQPGNSGGPLLDMNGNVIGIIVAMLDAKTAFKISGSLPQNVNYAVKSTYAQALLDTLPEVSGSLLLAYTKKSFDNVVNRVKKCVVLIVTYE
jgi:TPR repeat protein